MAYCGKGVAVSYSWAPYINFLRFRRKANWILNIILKFANERFSYQNK